jgi:hypothetical protein
MTRENTAGTPGDSRPKPGKCLAQRASAMAQKESASKLAPPTRAPSTLAWVSSSAALSGFTEPP